MVPFFVSNSRTNEPWRPGGRDLNSHFSKFRRKMPHPAAFKLQAEDFRFKEFSDNEKQKLPLIACSNRRQSRAWREPGLFQSRAKLFVGFSITGPTRNHAIGI